MHHHGLMVEFNHSIQNCKGGRKEEGGKVRSGEDSIVDARYRSPQILRALHVLPTASLQPPSIIIISIYLKECHLAYICLYARWPQQQPHRWDFLDEVLEAARLGGRPYVDCYELFELRLNHSGISYASYDIDDDDDDGDDEETSVPTSRCYSMAVSDLTST